VVLAGENPARLGERQGPAFDAFDAKAEALALLAEAGAPVDNLQLMGEAGPQFHPGQSATLRLGPKNVLARFGVLHPATRRPSTSRAGGGRRSISTRSPPRRALPVCPRLCAARTSGGEARLRLPGECGRAAGDVLRAVRGADKASIVAARVRRFPRAGRARRAKVWPSKSPCNRAKELTDADLKAIADKVSAAAAKLGRPARIRGLA
jgi:phenylalanyl-tRNA synthetase beta chain